jgi:hypothetical protein
MLTRLRITSILLSEFMEFLTTSSIIVIEQFMALLVLRHTLPLVVSGDGEYSFALFSVRVMINIVLIRLRIGSIFLLSEISYCLLHSIKPLILHYILWETKIKLLVLRTAGILFPILVMVRALANYHRRRRQQVIPALID